MLIFLFLTFLFFFLHFLISAFMTQIFNPIAELVFPTGIRTKEAKAEMETHPLTIEIKIS